MLSPHSTRHSAASDTVEPTPTHKPPAWQKVRPLEREELKNIKRVLVSMLREHGFQEIWNQEFPVPGFTYGFVRNSDEPIIGITESPTEVRVYIAAPEVSKRFGNEKYTSLFYNNPSERFLYTKDPIVIRSREDGQMQMANILDAHRIMIENIRWIHHAESRRSNTSGTKRKFHQQRHRETVIAERERQKVLAERPIMEEVRIKCAQIGMLIGAALVAIGAEEPVPHYIAEKSIELGLPDKTTAKLMEADIFYDGIARYKEKSFALRVVIALAIGGTLGGTAGLIGGQLAGRYVAHKRREEIAKTVTQHHVARLYQ